MPYSKDKKRVGFALSLEDFRKLKYCIKRNNYKSYGTYFIDVLRNNYNFLIEYDKELKK